MTKHKNKQQVCNITVSLSTATVFNTKSHWIHTVVLRGPNLPYSVLRSTHALYCSCARVDTQTFLWFEEYHYRYFLLHLMICISNTPQKSEPHPLSYLRNVYRYHYERSEATFSIKCEALSSGIYVFQIKDSIQTRSKHENANHCIAANVVIVGAHFFQQKWSIYPIIQAWDSYSMALTFLLCGSSLWWLDWLENSTVPYQMW